MQASVTGISKVAVTARVHTPQQPILSVAALRFSYVCLAQNILQFLALHLGKVPVKSKSTVTT